jgi:hypothetical protein
MKSRMTGSWIRRAAVLALAGLAIGAVPMLADASQAKAKLKVEIRDRSLGKVWDAGNVRVRVKAGRPGTAKVAVKAAGKTVTKPRTAKVPRAGRTVAAKLSKAGKETLQRCTTSTLRASVSFNPRSGRRLRRTVSATLTNNLGPCSVASEDPDPQAYHGPAIRTPNADRCDFLDTSVCLYPFPNDYYTVEDPSSLVTGKRVHLNVNSMPKNAQGTPIDPTDHNRADGFGPGQPIALKVPGIDSQAEFDANGLVPADDLAAYADPDQPLVVINADTGERHPVFAEVDANAATDRDRALYIRPSVNFEEGARYIVALRGLERADGEPLQPPLAFRAYRDRLLTDNAAIEDRRAHMEELISTLQAAGIPRANLYLAWDFTVASAESIAGRVLAMRDDAFARLGDTVLDDLEVQGSSPAFTIDPITSNLATTGVINYELCSAGDPEMCEPGEDDRLLRLVRGKITTPCYLNTDGCPPGAQFAFSGPDDLMPNFDPSFDAEVSFTCVIPRSVSEGGTVNPARPSLYGHGLLGSRSEVESGSGGNIKAMANDHNFVFCATNWAGFSSDDLIAVALPSLQDTSNFPKLADRVQQGFINFMYLGRAMIHEDGLGSNPAFQVDPDGEGGNQPESVIDGARLFYDGNSQGGILGGALTALAPDFVRAVLGVPAMNYSTLLQRSVDFPTYASILYPAYPNELERPLWFSLVQMLWDRSEPDGFAQHMTTDPYPNTPEHHVLLHVAFGDHQVANLAAEVEARTIGASAYQPALDPGRHWDQNPLWGIPPIESFPYDGSAIVYWDGGPEGFDGTIGFGTSTPPIENMPPTAIEDQNEDPHAYPRRDAHARQQKSDFLQVGGFINPCADNGPCYANGYPGPGAP